MMAMNEGNPESLTCLILTNEEATTLQEALKKKPRSELIQGKKCWLVSPQGSPMGGEPPKDTDLEYDSIKSKSDRLLEQVRFINGDAELIAKQKEGVSWLSQNTELKMKFLESTVLPCFDVKKKDGFKKLKSRLNGTSKIMSTMLGNPFEDYIASHNSEIINKFREFDKLPEAEKKSITDFAQGLKEVNACYTKHYDSNGCKFDSQALQAFNSEVDTIIAKYDDLVCINLNAHKANELNNRIKLFNEKALTIEFYVNQNQDLNLDFYVQGGKTVFEYFFTGSTINFRPKMMQLVKKGKLSLEQTNAKGQANLEHLLGYFSERIVNDKDETIFEKYEDLLKPYLTNKNPNLNIIVLAVRTNNLALLQHIALNYLDVFKSKQELDTILALVKQDKAKNPALNLNAGIEAELDHLATEYLKITPEAMEKEIGDYIDSDNDGNPPVPDFFSTVYYLKKDANKFPQGLLIKAFQNLNMQALTYLLKDKEKEKEKDKNPDNNEVIKLLIQFSSNAEKGKGNDGRFKKAWDLVVKKTPGFQMNIQLLKHAVEAKNEDAVQLLLDNKIKVSLSDYNAVLNPNYDNELIKNLITAKYLEQNPVLSPEPESEPKPEPEEETKELAENVENDRAELEKDYKVIFGIFQKDSVNVSSADVTKINEVSEKYKLYGESVDTVNTVNIEALKAEVIAYGFRKNLFSTNGYYDACLNSLNNILSDKPPESKSWFIKLWGIYKNRDERKKEQGRISALTLLIPQMNQGINKDDIEVHLRGQYLGMVAAELEDKLKEQPTVTVKAAAISPAAAQAASPAAAEQDIPPRKFNHALQCKTTGWHNNCALNCLTHFLYGKLQTGDLQKSKINAQAYQALLTTFKSYYNIEGNLSWDNINALLSEFKVPHDREAVLAPVLRQYLAEVLKNQKELLWNTDATVSFSDYLQTGNARDVSWPVFNSNKAYFEQLKKEYDKEKAEASKNLKAFSEEERTYAKALIDQHNKEKKQGDKNFLEPNEENIAKKIGFKRGDDLLDNHMAKAKENWMVSGCNLYADYIGNLENDVMVSSDHIQLLCQNLDI